MMSVILQLLGLTIITIGPCIGLYEDQVGKFEWRQQYIGKLKFGHLDVMSPMKKVIIASEKNVVAALSLKSGDIVWRQMLESGENGIVRLLSVDKEVMTVSGTNAPLVRGWDLERGHLLWEWGVAPLNEETQWTNLGQKLVQIDFKESSHVAATLFHSPTGRILRTHHIPATWLVAKNCVVQNDVIACISAEKSLYSIRLVDNGDELDIKVHRKLLLDLFREEVTGPLKTTAGKLPIVSLKVGNVDRALVLEPEIQVLESGEEKTKIFGSTVVEQQDILASIVFRGDILEITMRNFDGGEELPELSNKMSYPEASGRPDFGLMFCQARKDRGVACRLLLSTTHDVIMLVHHPGNILWSREEALSSILTVDMMDLPVSDTDAAIEKEFDNKNSGFIGMFFRRIISQTLQVQNLILTVLGLKGASMTRDNDAMIQDEFGLHKLIVAVTRPGKIYGLDNLTGRIVWQIKVEDVKPLGTGTTMTTMPLYLIRNARHHPLPARCAVLAKDAITERGVVILFNPIDGSLQGVEGGVVRLNFKVKQSLLLHLADESFSRGILLLDEDNNVHAYPPSSKSIALSDPSSIFMFTADANTGIMEGFTLAFSTGDTLMSAKTWRICLGTRILAVVGKNPNERVHSQGRVLGDRSVLYKYVNPNLVAVVTKGSHPSCKTIVNLHLIDVVSGSIIYSSTHRRAKEPVHVVHSENWVVYTYFNEKYRRTELGSLEMYEGKTQSNATAFSSLDSSTLLPIVERQAYILPANVLSLRETITEKGITSKHILIALSTGGILEMPWIYADPRRPMTVTPEMREEGVIPYMPELPIPLEAVINHNQTVVDVRGIHTSSSGLESTCLVFAYGLDVFYTRVAPSKTFDLLKEDFDYYLITIVLIALTVISYVTKRLASRKALKQAWK